MENVSAKRRMLIFLAKHLQNILGPAMETQLLRMSYTKAFYTGKYLKQKDLMYSISVWFCSTSEIISEDDYRRWWWRIEDYAGKETRRFGDKKRRLSNH
ncbi:hypothetical protein L1987_75777 [Smallanthus sonchifolius]|uniref:Uncharacterized protein n=1 Tax=Smallanthus sonchifolius TaxID=185202 RepID=A0ACB9A6P7_9ASTR|nr:hypothetical protein L1987_75777 [Smallanthus sonchifolius]